MNLLFPRKVALERNAIADDLRLALRHYAQDLNLLVHLRWLGFQPDVVYDIGASNGIWSAMAGYVFPQAHFELFEPLYHISETYAKARVRHPAISHFANNLSHKVHSLALGSRNGVCKFARFSNESGSTSLQVDASSEGVDFVEVPMKRLDDLVQAEKLRPPALIKMDTQASELDILTASENTLRHCKVLFLEGWLVKGYGIATPLLLDMANFLGRFGLRLFAYGDEYRGPDGSLTTKDVVFVHHELPLEARPPHPF